MRLRKKLLFFQQPRFLYEYCYDVVELALSLVEEIISHFYSYHSFLFTGCLNKSLNASLIVGWV